VHGPLEPLAFSERFFCRRMVQYVSASGPGSLRMTVRQILKILRKDGWYVDHQTGSHRQLHHPTKPGNVTVAGKPKDDINPNTLTEVDLEASRPWFVRGSAHAISRHHTSDQDWI
jgi:predicted RNA binding protein YcfA (HicA-like mRNA interferase family)